MTNLAVQLTQIEDLITRKFDELRVEIQAMASALSTVSVSTQFTADAIEDALEQTPTEALSATLAELGMPAGSPFKTALNCLYVLASGEHRVITGDEAINFLAKHPKFEEFYRSTNLSRHDSGKASQIIAVAYCASLVDKMGEFNEFYEDFLESSENNAATQLRVAYDDRIDQIRSHSKKVVCVAHAWNRYQGNDDTDFENMGNVRLRGWNVEAMFGTH